MTFFDTLTRASADGQSYFFDGDIARGLFGGQVPLMSVPGTDEAAESNFDHVGNPIGSGLPGDLLSSNLLYFELFPQSIGLPTSLDLALLADVANLSDLDWGNRWIPRRSR